MKNNQARTENQVKPNRTTPQFNVARFLRTNAETQTWGDDELYFFAEAIDAGRNLTIENALRFFRGMIKLCGRDRRRLRVLRAIVAALSACNTQLDLLQIGLDPFTPETN